MSRVPFFACASFFLLMSCESQIHETIRGTWSIDRMIDKRYDILPCFSLNIISFKDETCELPVTVGVCIDPIEYVAKAEWSLEDKKDRPLILTMTGENELFSGRHQVTFYKDTVNRLLFMRLKKDSLYILCRKGYFDYNHNEDLVNELIERTR